ncbi:Site-specific recombinase XerD [Georgenia satyanarayanai]|uniref:Site-specific recombinase XerD n=1 Tax=Georgenia satyanarayanai TaxID=860221 RepID=A0A2Y9A8Y8_9MICO|nr:site-specific integrase [Georgenia satyanarayanai]PYG00200.1 site-specific recombinase XerD [Georgenia satyanarayanai]SSA40446.1 Site-specific recombinase XerD [Georgenia satyanarayanai]
MASLQTRTNRDGSTSYRVVFRLDGRQKPLTYGTAAAAQDAIDILDRHGPAAGYAILEARSRTTTAPTLATQLDTHLGRVAAHATPGTVAGYRREAARTWLPRLGDYPLDALTRDHVTEWITWQRGQETDRSRRARVRASRAGHAEPAAVTYSPKSIRNAHSLLSAVLASAVEDGHVPGNVARGIRVPSDHADRGRVFLLPDEFTAIYAHIPHHYRPLVATLYGTGMRWGEATALLVGSIELDGDQGLVHVRQAWKRGEQGDYLGAPKSRRALRTISIEGPLVDLLRDHLAGRRPVEFAFTAQGGGRVWEQAFRPRVWQRAVEASGITKRPDLHSLRHSHASNLIRAGIPLTVVQRRLGHESIKTTSDIYGHLAPDAHAGAARAAALSMVGALPELEA